MFNNYKEWAMKRDIRLQREWADFGFFDKKDDYKRYKDTDQHPIKAIDVQEVLKEIMRMPPVNSYRGQQRFADTVIWGNEIGALLLDISPLGSFKACVRRMITDLQGENRWICKRVVQLNEKDYTRTNLLDADSIYKEISDVSKGMIDSPTKDYQDFGALARKLFTQTRLQFPSYCMFAPKIKQLTEDYYKIYFGFKGHGVEAPTASRAEQFDIDLFYDKDKGLIRCWGYDIDSPTNQHKWAVQPAEWDEWFAPTQPIEEIIQAVIHNLMTY